MVRALSRLALFALPLLGCSQDTRAATQLILVADTNIDRLDSIEFRVEAPSVPAKTATATRDRSGKPAYLTLYRERGPLGPLTVTAVGMSGTMSIVSRTHIVSFVEGQTLVVPLHLVETCINKPCLGQTCGELSCTPRALDMDSLLPWSGEPPSLGGSMTQCDAMTDLQSDPQNCGMCDEVCPLRGSLQHSVATCVGGVCGTACEPLFANCDGRAENGCEQSLTQAMHCGECNKRCVGNMRCTAAGTCVEK